MKVFTVLVVLAALLLAPASAFVRSAPRAPLGDRLRLQAKQVEVTFTDNGKTVLATQGEPIGNVAKRAGVRIQFDCKKGRCGTCEVRLNGRASAKICQGAKIPMGPAKKLSIQYRK
uniref:2Fe-2S ferredoxin-type domain-containing protein n=1 Tax=Pinguiococcus pyrenoidosus TaxID=172671 RepID=A0A7R9YBE8_9STRA